MEIFFTGNYLKNGGPWNVNKGLIKEINRQAWYVVSKWSMFRFGEIIFKILFSKVVIFSGISRVDHIFILLCTILKKRIIYIMHGCLEYEFKVNKVTNNDRGLKNENLLLKYSDKILCVSKPYQLIIAKRYPMIKNKLSVLTNGIDWESLDCHIRNIQVERVNNSILLIGGGRVTKRNLQICQAVQIIKDIQNINITVDLYGDYSANDDSDKIMQIPCVNYHPVIPHDKIIKEHCKHKIFIQNSEFEPFGLGIIDALCCGNDILISKNVGAIDIIQNIECHDIINNPFDIDEIVNKITNILSNSNNKRLYNSINKHDTTFKVEMGKLLIEAKSLLYKQ